MRPSAAEKEAERQATLFEERVRSGLISIDGSTRFSDYAEQWMKTTELAPATHNRYESLLGRINIAIGHIRLDKLQAHHLEAFYLNLKEAGIKENGLYAYSKTLDKKIKNQELSTYRLAKIAGVSESTVSAARAGNRISVEKAVKIAKVINADYDELFLPYESTEGLSDKTILHHHRLICAILEKAKRNRIIPFNVAKEHTTAPKVKYKEAVYLNETQAQKIVELLLSEEDIRASTAILLLLYSGVRRGELCGLEWRDVDFNKQIIRVCRASQYQRGIGVVEVPTKNISSIRTIKLPIFMTSVLQEYQRWWEQEKNRLGTAWIGDKNRLFIQGNGKPINPDTINYWLEKFREKHNLPYFTPHSCRHTFATLQIAGGVDIRTLQARTGHAQASTLVNTYSHAIKSAAEAASDVLDDMLTPKKRVPIKRNLA